MSIDYAQAIAAEKKAVSDIKKMTSNNAAALRLLWHWGDGDGGAILDMIAMHLGKDRPSGGDRRNLESKSKKGAKE